MELIYVWIEEYKNIKNQGFNFSPDFWFEFKNGELNVEKREGLPKNFFGENIVNVTAIVGENGAGKTTLLKFIGDKLFQKTRDEDPWEEKNSLISIWRKDKEIFILHSPEHSGIDQTKIEGYVIDIEEYGHIAANNQTEDGRITQSADVRFLRDRISACYYSNYVHSQSYTNFHVRGEGDLSSERAILMAGSLEQYYVAEGINRLNYLIEKAESPTVPTMDFIEEIQNVEISIQYYGHPNRILAGFDALPKIDKIKSYPMPYAGILSYILKKVVNEIGYANDNKNLLTLLEKLPSLTSGSQFRNEKQKQNVIDLIESFGRKYGISNLKGFISTFEALEETYPSSEIRDFEPIIYIRRINVKDDRWLPLVKELLKEELSEKLLNITFPGLSSGEDAFFSLFCRLYNKLKIGLDIPAIFLIDEAELGFHPQWQKEYFKHLIELFNIKELFTQKVQLVIATHSPFLLSDIPKENVIFLAKEDGKTEVVPGIEKQNTFGANIHTLFTDSFFMEGGLIGEFAKGKINEIIYILRTIVTHHQKGYDDSIKAVEVFFERLIKEGIKEQNITILCQDYIDSAKTSDSKDTKKQLAAWGIENELLTFCQQNWEKAKAFRTNLLDIYEYVKTIQQFNDPEKREAIKSLIFKIGDMNVQDKLLQMYAMAEQVLTYTKKSLKNAQIELLKARIKELENQ